MPQAANAKCRYWKCLSEPQTGKTYCPFHLESQRAAYRCRLRRKNAGSKEECRRCSQSRAPQSFTYCPEHLAQAADQRRAVRRKGKDVC